MQSVQVSDTTMMSKVTMPVKKNQCIAKFLCNIQRLAYRKMNKNNYE
jgi:hypothetical protein